MTEPQDYDDVTYLQELAEKKDIEGLMDFVEHSQKKSLLASAIYTLGTEKADQAVGLLIFQALRGKWAKVRHAAVVALGEIGSPVAVKPLTMLLNKQDEVEEGDSPSIGDCPGEVVLEALGKIGKIGNQEAIWIIVQALDSQRSEAASRVLKEMGEPAVVILISSLDGENETIKREAIRALGAIGSKKSAGPLIAMLEKLCSDNLSIAEEIVQALGRIRDPKAVGPLMGILKPDTSHEDTDYRLQCLVITALGEIGNKQATDVLIQLVVNDSEIRVRGTAAAALGRIGDDRAAVPLITILENEREDEAVKETAAWALSRLDENQVALPLFRYLKKSHKKLFAPMIDFESDPAKAAEANKSQRVP